MVGEIDRWSVEASCLFRSFCLWWMVMGHLSEHAGCGLDGAFDGIRRLSGMILLSKTTSHSMAICLSTCCYYFLLCACAVQRREICIMLIRCCGSQLHENMRGCQIVQIVGREDRGSMALKLKFVL